MGYAGDHGWPRGRRGEAGQGAGRLAVVRLVACTHLRADRLVLGQVVAGIDGAELDDAAGAAAAVERGGRAAQHLDLLQHAGIDEELAVVARIVVLPRAVEEADDARHGATADDRPIAGAARGAGDSYERYVAGAVDWERQARSYV